MDFPLIEQDSPPVELVVHLTADPCPEVKWYINDTLITDKTSNFEVYEYIQLMVCGSEPPMSVELSKFLLYLFIYL